jgi:CubicO group peptidase (beta-lactamase class C family)
MEYKIDPIGGNLRYPNHWMALSARDLVKFGQFYLQRGGLTKARAPYRAQDIRGVTSAYGLLWWVAGEENGVVPPGTFTAFGFGGSYLTVLPVLEMVVVSLVDTRSQSFKGITGEAYNELLGMIVNAVSVR